jgi:hypothetical protein
MAKKRPTPGSTSVNTQRYDKELIEDVSDYHLGENVWTHARNAITNSTTGDFGDIGNEPSNIHCASAPYTVIGTIHIQGDRWAIFSTDDSNSEVGLFDESACTYTTVVNAACLGFRRTNLITGISKENFDCRWSLYWADGLNPDRYLTIDIDTPSNNDYTNPESSIPWIQDCVDDNGPLPGGCIICTNTPDLDCDKTRLEDLLSQPCFSLSRGVAAGTVRNGSYFVVGAYMLNDIKVGDYSPPSEVQPIFTHGNVGASLEIQVDFADQRFDEMEVVLVSFVNEQTTARRVGVYSTRQKVITLDFIDDRWIAIGLDQIPLRTTIAERSDSIFRNGNYAIRIGPTNKFDFNYQPLANQITAKWQSVEYPEAYYYKGGNNTGYLRDEVYSFFIRWVYHTGDKSASYHIPGRPQFTSPVWIDPDTGIPTLESGTSTSDDLESAIGETPYNWIVHNTGVLTGTPGTVLPDGGTLIAEGHMAYWESAEFYDDDTPEIWNAGVTGTPYSQTNPADYDLCGKPIRHHKFPDNMVDPRVRHYRCANNTGLDGVLGNDCHIRIMGVAFDNIQVPVMNPQDPPAQWIPIPGIVGYEILRGSRSGNKSILAKGIVNNMFEYDLDGDPDSAVSLVTNRTGLYPNYPYNDLRPDHFLHVNEVTWETTEHVGWSPNPFVNRRNLSFHSPDTQFADPFLSTGEMKIYGEVVGAAVGSFVEPDGHPKHKFVTDAAFIASIIVGIGYAITQMNGQKRKDTHRAQRIHLGGDLLGGYATGGIPGLTSSASQGISYGVATGLQSAYWATEKGLQLLDGIVGTSTEQDLMDPAYSSADGGSGYIEGARVHSEDQSGTNALPGIFKIASGFVTFYNYFTEGVDTTIKVIMAFSKFKQFALQWESHCKYGVYGNSQENNRRFNINDARYIDPYFQDFTDDFRINNLNRNRFVALNLHKNVSDTQNIDNSKNTVGQLVASGGFSWDKPTQGKRRQAASHYVGLKQKARNQYGQLDSIVQVPVSTCMSPVGDGGSPLYFNGDTYIGRHTEKNKMPFFYDWLQDEIDGTEFDYKLHQSVPHTAFWMDTETFEWSDFVESLTTAQNNTGSVTDFLNGLVTPSDLHSFDRNGTNETGFFTLKNCYMYLFNCGIRDFFVESSINVDLRDWGEAQNERHYHPYSSYTDLKELFSTRIIKQDNFFKYDFNLSISKLFNNYISWGTMQPRSYNPNDAEACYTYRPKRMTYSLPQNIIDSKRDNWRTFLPLNFKDFVSRPVAVKPIYSSGALILFENESPVLFKGVEELRTTGDTKITIGDGGLFNLPMQSVNNSDRPYEYGSCQNIRCIVNTPFGAFYMSQNQGKIFMVTKTLKELSMPGKLKWWFSTFLPYKLTDFFPDFELLDNPVVGIGCQAIYDNENQIIYFCKKDYTLREDIDPSWLEYIGGNQFLLQKIATIELGDPRYFKSASWTVSYDMKKNTWVGWHDWHPDLLMGGKTNFMSISQIAADSNKVNGIWIHNRACDSYCNFYGFDFPFEIEFPVNTLQTVNTLRSIEYQLEAYRYDPNCYDRFHVLDFNFDQAVVYNSEQCSGMLNLILSPKNNAPVIVNYPIVNFNTIDILYSKEEQKYRFNQFFDITNDRGEFTNTEEVIWNTEANGYIRLLNPLNLDYGKAQTQRKKFRHYENMVFLRRIVSGNRKILLMLTNAKNFKSPR